ncbi:MAG: HEAT repeat domain-containing protein [Planctomycetota bacterium]|nr:HEAT repeat domain-containing protein [Planctomycetota bacterium]
MDPLLEKLLAAAEDPEPHVRLSALDSMKDLDAPKVRKAIEYLTTDTEPQIRSRAVEVLGKKTDRESFKPLLDALEDDEPMVRFSALTGLKRHIKAARSGKAEWLDLEAVSEALALLMDDMGQPPWFGGCGSCGACDESAKDVTTQAQKPRRPRPVGLRISCRVCNAVFPQA